MSKEWQEMHQEIRDNLAKALRVSYRARQAYRKIRRKRK